MRTPAGSFRYRIGQRPVAMAARCDGCGRWHELDNALEEQCSRDGAGRLVWQLVRELFLCLDDRTAALRLADGGGVRFQLSEERSPVKPLLVGEANPYGADPYFALYPLPEHASGGRLARILGLSEQRYLDAFDRRNLCPTEWSMRSARAEAAMILAAPPRPVVLLGAKVSKAFGLDYQPFTRSAHLFILPHPSGLNRIWNMRGSVARARELAAQFLEVQP